MMTTEKSMWIPRTVVVLQGFAVLCFISAFFGYGSAQRTDPTEVNALNTIFRKWNISSSMSRYSWNTTGDPCSSYAIFADNQNYKDKYDLFNPSILCDCSYNNGSTCHIIRLTVYKLGIVGIIPEELKYLSKLDNLQLAENHLSGPLPAFFGNFSDMKYLSIGKNALSGPLPKELGNLQNLISLGLGMNNFSGSLPPELGNMTSLEKMYIDSIGVVGEIPSTFGNLQKLKFMWASDNNFGGKVPDFLGNLTNIDSVRLQGNSFQGPIPSNLGNLRSLAELRLSDLSNGTSSLAFISNMKSLVNLILRDCKISDTIPSDIGEYKNLKYLDLSFNNLTGTLPTSIFNMDSLELLYLGNNSISGEVPVQKSANLLNIDLSYNELSGSIPPWAGDENLQLNLVANNFTVGSSRSMLPWGFECLQKSIPCFRGHPQYYSFAINCGGNEIQSSSGTVYEADSQNLTTASFYVNKDKRWAVSSIGRFVESPEPKYIETSSSKIAGTSDPQLFQSARLSPSSLRYYGLGLEKGSYSISLQFAEIAFTDDPVTQKNSGRRVFDIYIQDNLVAKDFDVKKEAGGFPFRAITREYNASVTDNFLEIHFFWAGKGTCCLPTQGYYGSLVSAINVTPRFKPTVSNHPPTHTSNNSKRIGLIIGSVLGVAVLLSTFVIGSLVWRRRDQAVDEELIGLSAFPNTFSYLELKNATEDFKSSNVLGKGGYGHVFKGILSNGTVVAVKQLSETSIQGKRQFVTEVATISAVKHRNLVTLYGCCYEGNKRILVYEYLENTSLDKALFGKNELKLDWPQRFEICLGTARGLAYIHEESRVRMIHRDIKAGNILLDADLNPKISDFGLARLYADNLTHLSTGVAGTVGYLAPEYAMRGHLTEKVDVFSFGVVALELVCGKRNTDTKLDSKEMYLLEWTWNLHENGRDLEMVDPSLNSFNKEEASRIIGVAFQCTQFNPKLRPSMSRVVAMLVGDLEIAQVLSKPSYLIDSQFDDSATRGSSSETHQVFVSKSSSSS